MITWITENIAIGEYLDAINEELLKKEKIDCVLSLRGGEAEQNNLYEEKLCRSLGISFCNLPVIEYDFLDILKIQLKSAAYMLDLLSQKYKRILVHCTAGIDRSPFILASWLANKEYYRLDIKDQFVEAYRDIKRKRPQIVEHYEWI